MIPGKFIIQGWRVIWKFHGCSRYKNLMCNYYHKKGHIRTDCWLQKKKQVDAELIGKDEDKCDILSVIDRSVGNKNRWIIDFGCS